MDDPSSWRGLLKEFMEEGKLLPCPFLEIYGQEKFLILMKSDFKKKKKISTWAKKKKKKNGEFSIFSFIFICILKILD